MNTHTHTHTHTHTCGGKLHGPTGADRVCCRGLGLFRARVLLDGWHWRDTNAQTPTPLSLYVCMYLYRVARSRPPLPPLPPCGVVGVVSN